MKLTDLYSFNHDNRTYIVSLTISKLQSIIGQIVADDWATYL